MTATKVKVASKKPIAFFDMAWGGWEFCIFRILDMAKKLWK
jgi:phosphatidylglycerophosphatase A